MTHNEVPEGTIPEVLAWVGDDPELAQDALDSEREGSNRSTLINQLESILARDEEAPVSDPEATEPADVEETEDAPAPVPPSGDDLVVDLSDPGVVIGPRNVASPDVDVPDDNYDNVRAEALEAEEDAPVDASGVDFFQVASTTAAVVINFDGAAVKLDAQQATALSRDLRSALANVTY